MTAKNFFKFMSIKELMIFLAILVSGGVYVLYTWNDVHTQTTDEALQIARSVEASLPKNEIKSLTTNPGPLNNSSYRELKTALNHIVEANKNARFACLCARRNDKLYILVDSEPETSQAYFPPGRELAKTSRADLNLFIDGEAPVISRNASLLSAKVPVIDDETGSVMALFAMDYNIVPWRNELLFKVSQSVLLVFIILFLVFLFRHSFFKNFLLQKEMKQRKNAENELKESESYFRLLFELNPQPLFVYDLESMRIMEVNDSTISTYGYTRQELLNMTIIDLKAPKELTRLWKNLIDNPNSFQQTEIWNHQKKDGQIIQVEVHSHNIDFRHKDARLVLLFDVTEKLKIEKTLREKESILTNLTANLPGMIYRCALDENYTMKFLSEACSDITGYPPDDFIENKKIAFNDLILPEYRKPIGEKWLKIMNEKKSFEEEYPIKTASGEIKWLYDRGACIFDENGELLYLEGYIEDITEMKKNETELAMARKKLEESKQTRAALLASFSHEIRTPMNGILGFADLLKTSDLSPENQADFINIIENSGQRMINTINDLIILSN